MLLISNSIYTGLLMLQVIRACFWVAVICVFFAIGTLDYQEELMEQRVYCFMVKSKLWPDYQSSNQTECISEV